MWLSPLLPNGMTPALAVLPNRSLPAPCVLSCGRMMSADGIDARLAVDFLTTLPIRSAMFISTLSLTRWVRGWTCTYLMTVSHCLPKFHEMGLVMLTLRHLAET